VRFVVSFQVTVWDAGRVQVVQYLAHGGGTQH
jgi:hypothetical protein